MARATHLRTCHLCEAMCGLVIETEDEQLVRNGIRGDKDDPFSRGHLCPKGPAMAELHADPDRLRHPMKRTPSGWQRVSWDEALDDVATRLRNVQREHGHDGVGLYVGNPAVHNHGALLGLQGFTRALRTKNRFDANSQDANPKLLACMLMYGDQLSITVPDVDRTDFMLMLGANPAASNGSLMTLGDVKGRLRGIRERGGRLVLIDPRRTESVDWATEHHFIRPGADALFLLALHHVLFAEGLVDARAVDAVATGRSELERLVRAFAPERVAERVGIPAETIRSLARDFARARRAVVYGRVGVCTTEFGAAASWLIETLNVIGGRFDAEGGHMFPTPAVDLAALGRKLAASSYARWRSRVRGLPEVGGQLPAAVMAEEIETPGEGQIRALVTVAGNPVLSTPNGERLGAALERLDFMVSVDIYINETSRHAHYILPPRSALERSHFDLVFNALAVRNTAKYSEPALPPSAGSKTDWEILYELGMRLGGMRFGVPAVDKLLGLAHRVGFVPDVDRLVDLALRVGPYGARIGAPLGGLSISKLKKSPHGVDLGPLVPSASTRVRLAGNKVDLVPAPLVADLPRVEAWLEAASADLVLIGRRHLRTNNSWMHNCHSLAKGPSRSQLELHPDDARARGISDGDTVILKSRVGEVEAVAKHSADLMRGVVSLPHGYGHASAKDTMRIAGALAGPNANALTDELFLDPISGTAALNGVEVRVEARVEPRVEALGR